MAIFQSILVPNILDTALDQKPTGAWTPASSKTAQLGIRLLKINFQAATSEILHSKWNPGKLGRQIWPPHDAYSDREVVLCSEFWCFLHNDQPMSEKTQFGQLTPQPPPQAAKVPLIHKDSFYERWSYTQFPSGPLTRSFSDIHSTVNSTPKPDKNIIHNNMDSR